MIYTTQQCICLAVRRYFLYDSALYFICGVT